MGLINDFKNSIQQSTLGKVWGTFNKTFSALDNERDREDGTTVFDLVPEIRVFVGGAEVTKDVDSVNVSHSLDGNSCSISIHNPRGRYEVSKYDLMMKWREDKDILAAYDYKDFDRIDPLNYDVLARKLGDALIGRGGGALVGEAIDMTKQTVGLLGGLLNPFPLVRGTTRMLFETKFASGLIRKAGDCIFDYRDPVYVFMKGRFSTYWYFAFSGFVTAYSDSDAYGDIKNITLKCEDTATLWKKTKMSTKGAFFGMSNLENRITNTSKNTKTMPYGDFTSKFSFSQLMKVIAFSTDYGLKTKNCHPSAYDINIAYKDRKPFLHSGAKIDKDFKFTYNKKALSINGRTVFAGQGLIDSANINYNSFKGGPNKYPLGPISSIYLQHNEIELPSGKLTGTDLEQAFDLSVRYWEADQEIDEWFFPGSDQGTGWKDKNAFGVCGAHPALTYNFIDNFSMLETVWKQIYIKKKNLDNIIISPYDKIRETVVGSPTESSLQNTSSISKEPAGTNINLFRPRLFVVLPQKYASVRKAGNEGFGNLGQLFDEQSTTIYDYLKEKLKAVEYINYTSPMGDIFIEPMLYDLHPLEFCDRIEGRNIIQKKETIRFSHKVNTEVLDSEGKQTKNTDGSAKIATKRQTMEEPAYFFNTKANHPFFIMDKDRIRDTYEFSPDKLTSVVEVQGSMTDTGGVVESIRDAGVNKAFGAIAMGNQSQLKTNSVFQDGVYIADGFDDYFSDSSVIAAFQEQKKKLEQQQSNIRRLVFISFTQIFLNSKISDLIKGFQASILDLKNTQNIEWEPDITADIESFNNLHPSEDDRLQYVAQKYCPAILAAGGVDLKTVSSGNVTVLNNFLDKKASDFFQSIIKMADQDLQILSYTSKLRTSANKAATGAETDNETRESIIAEYTNLGIFNIEDNSNENAIGQKRNVVIEFIRLVEPGAIALDLNNVQQEYKTYITEKTKLPLPQELRATSLKDLKNLQIKGIYDPRKDLVRLYGFKRTEPIKNPYIRNGLEAMNYAKAVFNRLYGQAQGISIDFIGRPELFLNRPYFFERKDCIGLMKNYNISFKYGGDFSSSATLTYVRKNVLTYGYTLGSELDEPKGDKTNSYFYKQGRLYLQTQTAIAQAGKLAGMAAERAIAGGGGGTGRKLTGNLLGEATTDVVTNMLQAGGIFVAHNILGHMDYDSRGRTPKNAAEEKTKQDTIIKAPYLVQSTLTGIAQDITNTKKNITDNTIKLKEIETNLTNKNTEITNKTTEIADLKTQIGQSYSGLDPKKTRKLNEDLRRKNVELDTLNKDLKAIQKNQTSLQENNKLALDKLFGVMLSNNLGLLQLSPLKKSEEINDTKVDHDLKEWYRVWEGVDYGNGGLFFKLLSVHAKSLSLKTLNDIYKFKITWEPINNYYIDTSALT